MLPRSRSASRSRGAGWPGFCLVALLCCALVARAAAQVSKTADRDPGFWSVNPAWIIALVCLVAGQTFLMGALFRRRRHRASLEPGPREDPGASEPDRLRAAILASMPAQIAVLDRAGTIIAVNDAWLAWGRAHGARHEASISPGASYMSACARAAAEGLPRSAIALDGVRSVCEGERDTFGSDYAVANGAGERWFSMKVVRLRRPAGGAVVTHRDITAERRQELAVRESERRFRTLAATLRDLSGRLMTAQEDERRRIARELHDDFQQRLALLAMELDGLANSPPTPAADALAARARDLWKRVVEISTDLHHLSYRLHPSKLEALGLLPTVKSYFRELAGRGLVVRFSHEAVSSSIAPDAALCVFRVLQESLQNVLKHSGAGEAHVTMTARGGRLRVAVVDEGRGFDTTAQSTGGLGLVSMRERLHLVGGELTIDSTPGRGTLVAFEVPCPEEEGAAGDGPASQGART